MTERLDAAHALRDADVPVVAHTLGTSVAALDAVPAAICAFLHHLDSFADAVTFAIELGGDTDTIASMTAAAARRRQLIGCAPASVTAGEAAGESVVQVVAVVV